jgi:uncharacterized protein YkwD
MGRQLFACVSAWVTRLPWRQHFLVLGAVVVAALSSRAASGSALDATAQQAPELAYIEAQTVYLGNLARRDNGLPPLRWNAQLTEAARWFSWDSTENQPPGFCDHRDSQGHWPDYRVRAFGYLGSAGAENAYCGFVTPQQAIDGWMASPGHRANLLGSGAREVGLGYYRRASDGRAYVTQDFGHDPVYAPMVINSEALTTTSTTVDLYLYDRESSGGFAGLTPATQMRLSNEACFANTTWGPYSPNWSWSLDSGNGWRMVTAATRDVFGRSMTVSDTIYLGASVPPAEIGQAQMSTTRPDVVVYELDEDWPLAQFSLGWLADNTFATFGGLWGEVAQVNDPAAWGGTAARLGPNPQGGETSAWVWDSTFIKGVPLVAYARLKVADRISQSEVARFAATGGGSQSLKSTDFAAPNQYQEFPLSFTVPTTETFLIFQFWRSGATEVYVDAVSIFTAPQAFTSPMTWAVPGGNYRGQGVQVRYSNPQGQFSILQEAQTTPPALSVSPSSVRLLAARSGPPLLRTVTVTQHCGAEAWQVEDDVPWLATETVGGQVNLRVEAAALSVGTYHATVIVALASDPAISATVPVDLTVVEQLHSLFVPLVQR